MGATLTRSPAKTAIKNILFATDFSPCSEVALPFAIAIAKRYGGTIFIAHVIRPEQELSMELGEPMGPRSAEDDPAFRAAQIRIEELEHRAALSAVQHQTVIEHGFVRNVLCHLVRQHSIDLIVAGTHGREGFRKLILGSVAEEIFRLATCPVMTVGPHVTLGMPYRLQRIVFATDFSAGSLHALPYALSFAEEDHARLTLVHAMQVDSIAASRLSSKPVQLAAEAEMWLRDLLPPEAAVWDNPEIVVRVGHAADVILAVATERNANLIVMGVHRAAASHFPWTVAHSVICRAQCPVLTVCG
jgi:nucleotide-binding universal stress UspA family protein